VPAARGDSREYCLLRHYFPTCRCTAPRIWTGLPKNSTTGPANGSASPSRSSRSVNYCSSKHSPTPPLTPLDIDSVARHVIGYVDVRAVRRHAATTATPRRAAHDLLLPGLPAEGLPSPRRARLGNHRCPTPPQRTVQQRPPRPEHSTRIDSLTRRVATTARIRRSLCDTALTGLGKAGRGRAPAPLAAGDADAAGAGRRRGPRAVARTRARRAGMWRTAPRCQSQSSTASVPPQWAAEYQ